MNDLESLMEARDTYKRYASMMRRLFGSMVLCWLAGVPLIIYAPIMLLVSVPAAIVSGLLAWWTFYDGHHGPYDRKRDRWGDLVNDFRPLIPGPRERLATAEADYRRTLN